MRFPIRASVLKNQWVQYGLLAVIVLIAAALRLFKLGEWSFWFDEVFTINRTLAHYSSLDSYLAQPLSSQLRFSVSLMLTGLVFGGMGVNELSARLVPAVIGVISVPILYLQTKKHLSNFTAILSSALLAISPWHLFWSQNARFYTALCLFVMIALFYFYEAFEVDAPKLIVVGYIFIFLAISERMTALLGLGAFILYLFSIILFRIERPKGLTLRNSLLFSAPILAFMTLEIVDFIVSGSSILANIFRHFGSYLGPSPERLVYRVAQNIEIPLFIAGIIGGVSMIRRKTRIAVFLFTYASVPVGVLLLLSPFFFTHHRYAFLSLPAWIILAGELARLMAREINQLEFQPILSCALPLLIVGSLVFTDLRYFNSNQGHRMNWKHAFQVIGSELDPGDPVVSYWPRLSEYYLNHQGSHLDAITPHQVRSSNRTHWFVIDDIALWASPQISHWVMQNCSLRMHEALILERPYNLSVYECSGS